MKKTVPDFAKMKTIEKISVITAYDYPSARLAEEADIDIILVGDSLGMVVLGYESTVPVTMEEMIHHTKAVRRGAPNTFIIADLPFMSYPNEDSALINAGRLIKEGGADAVKLEGGEFFARTVELLTKVGIPVVGHIGLTPQTANQLGGFKVQGRDIESIEKITNDAIILQNSGAFMIVLEAIPRQLAHKITETLNIPTIGIGAGMECDGQVLVFHDLLGIFDRFRPKFVKEYAQLGRKAIEAIITYKKEIKSLEFPQEEHTFGLSNEIIKKLYGEK